MKIARGLIISGLGLILLVTGIHVDAAENFHGSFEADSQEAIKKGLIDQQIRIMPQLNALNFGLGWSNNHTFYYEKTISKIFFQNHVLIVQIMDIDFDDSNITLKLFHPVNGSGDVTFIFNDNLLATTSDKAIQDILLNTLGSVNHRYVFGNPESRRYHLFSCLHAEDNSRYIRMSREEAEAQGYQPGGFCFRKMVYLPDLAIEREIEIQWLARLREHALFMGDLPEQDTLNRLGRRILENWPLQLLGYQYSFHLIYSQRLIVLATPTGKIFVTDALMDALENEHEIEAVLARAIAHIENRHSLKQYHSKKNAAKNEKFIQTLTGAAGSFAGIFAGAASGAIKALGNLPFKSSSRDDPFSLVYESDLEKEADALAALYFDRRQKDRRYLSAVIKKLQLANLYFNIDPKEKFDLNEVMANLEINEVTEQVYQWVWEQKKDVSTNDRVKRVQALKFRNFTGEKSFVLKKGRRLPVQLDLKYQRLIHNENRILVYISDKSLIHDHENSNNPPQVTLVITDNHGKHRFKLLNRHTTEDMWGVRMIFEASRGKHDRFLADTRGLEIEITEPQGPSDKENDGNIEVFKFVKGRLDVENRLAPRDQSDS